MNSSVFVADARGNTSGPTGWREDGRHSRKGQTGPHSTQKCRNTPFNSCNRPRRAAHGWSCPGSPSAGCSPLSDNGVGASSLFSRAVAARTANTSALCRESRSRTAARWRRRRLEHQIVTVDADFDAGGLSRLQCFNRAHSRVLQPGAPVFSGPDWGGGFASAPSAAVPALFFKGLARTVGALPLPLPSASRATVRRD